MANKRVHLYVSLLLTINFYVAMSPSMRPQNLSNAFQISLTYDIQTSF